MERKFAAKTEVPVARSRAEIDALLINWGCDGIRWTDAHRDGVTTLEFVWLHEEVDYMARIAITLPSAAELEQEAKHATRRTFSQAKYDQLVKNRGKSELRLLLLFLKASFCAIDAGIMEASAIFMPFLVCQNGQTMHEIAAPKLAEIVSGNAMALLGAGK